MIDAANQIKITEGDAKEFIDSLNKIIAGLIQRFQTKETWLIKIKNWFDHKWLNYSGVSVVKFDGGGIIEDAALNSEWREKITIPPFNPNRVLSESFFKIGNTASGKVEKALHKKMESNSNIHNRISNYTKNGLFIWYSSNTALNQKGSEMVYIVQPGIVKTFYASFENKDGWRIKQTKDISTSEFSKFLR